MLAGSYKLLQNACTINVLIMHYWNSVYRLFNFFRMKECVALVTTREISMMPVVFQFVCVHSTARYFELVVSSSDLIN